MKCGRGSGYGNSADSKVPAELYATRVAIYKGDVTALGVFFLSKLPANSLNA
jgi:hypothetical protein